MFNVGIEWKSHLLRGMISISRGGNVMPMENICSARVGLATLGGVGIA